MLNIHTDNSCIRPMPEAGMHALYIGMLWTQRKRPAARSVIRQRLFLLRQHRSGMDSHSLSVPRDALMTESRRLGNSATGI